MDSFLFRFNRVYRLVFRAIERKLAPETRFSDLMGSAKFMRNAVPPAALRYREERWFEPSPPYAGRVKTDFAMMYPSTFCVAPPSMGKSVDTSFRFPVFRTAPRSRPKGRPISRLLRWTDGVYTRIFMIILRKVRA